MNLFNIVLLIVVLAYLGRKKLPMLLWLAIWPIAVYLFIIFGIETPVPASVTKIYLWLTFLGALAYVFADDERCNLVTGQLKQFILDGHAVIALPVVETKFRLSLNKVVILLPILLAIKIYFDVNVDVKAATFGRTVHPPPPNTTDFKGKEIDLLKAQNPYREFEQSDKEKFAAHLANGKEVYYKNCVYCHGDDMNGDGVFAHAYAPVPANLNSPTTIAMLQESYLFWRIAKGGPGLPEESGPWSSSMPAWEKFLSEEEIWDVILYLYSYTGQKPRAVEEHH